MKKTIVDSIILETKEDYVGLWEIIKLVENYINIKNNDDLIDKTLKIIEELLNNYQIITGTFNEKKEFVKMDLPTTKIIDYIEKQWRELNRKPNIGEIIWFVHKNQEK